MTNAQVDPNRVRRIQRTRIITPFLCLLALLLFIVGARTATNAPVAAKLIIWPKVAGSATGSTMRVAIDGASAVAISNLKMQELISLGELSAGLHQYAITSIEIHSIDQAGNSQRINDGNGKCSGQFIVQPYQIYYVVLVGTSNGTDFQCRIQ